MKGKKHKAEQIIQKLREADAMLAAGKTLGQVVQALEISEQTLHRWRNQYGELQADSLPGRNAAHKFVVQQQLPGGVVGLFARPAGARRAQQVRTAADHPPSQLFLSTPMIWPAGPASGLFCTGST